MEPRARRDGDMLADPRRGAVIAIAALAAVVALTLLVAADVAHPPILQRIDMWWRDVIEPPETWAHRIGEWFRSAGSGEVMVPVRVAVAVVLLVRRRWIDLAAWLAGWAVADLVTQLLKPGLGRLRPDLSDTSSFPSGHAKTAAQVAVGLVLVLTSPWRSRRWAWLLAIAWIVAMSISRTVLGEHYLSDVVAGSLLGTGCAVGAAAILQLARDRRLARTGPSG
jgi:membrane-associated phospholipid phosphatase